MSVKLVSDEKIAETSSKGNQEKWLDNGVWYKLDQFGYESLAETLVSQLLCQSNIEQDTPFKFGTTSAVLLRTVGSGYAAPVRIS